MKNSSLIHGLPALAAAATLLLVPTAQAQEVTCATAEFTPTLLEQFPNARASCYEIKERDGQLVAVYRANLIRTTSRGLRVRFERPDGTRSDSVFVPVDSSFRVQVDGRARRLSEIPVGQVLTAYVPVSAPEPQVAFEPAEGSMLVLFVMRAAPDESESTAEAAMPSTAGPLPAIGLAGGVLVLLGTGIAWVRRRHGVSSARH
jgi:hypothetical protein